MQPANGTGTVNIYVVVGDPTTPADEADVAVHVAVKDVRNAGTLSDYAGSLSVEMTFQITDKDNTPNPGGPGAATASGFVFGLDVPCTPTPDPDIGSTCLINTSADAVLSEGAKERRRTVWELGAVEVRDGSGGLFMTEGLFIP